MSRALARRLTRLEEHARRVRWYADVRVSFVRLMAEAGAAVGLAPAAVQGLCTALAQTLHTFSTYVPACCSTDVPTCIADVQAVKAFGSRLCAAMLTMLDTQVTDPSTRYRLSMELVQAFDEEVTRRAGLS